LIEEKIKWLMRGTYSSDSLSGFELIDDLLGEGCGGISLCSVVRGVVDTLSEYC
jgi:hypothetical protein